MPIPVKHRLKTWPEYFNAVCSGNKTFEIRENDRNFKVNDILLLQEYKPESQEYTGRVVERKVSYITDFGQKDNYIVMGIR